MRLGSDAKMVLVDDVAILVVSQSRFVVKLFCILTLVLLCSCCLAENDEYDRYGDIWYIR
jgi:hypothetical protein